MRDVSDRWIETSQVGGELLAKLVCHPPPAADSDPFELTLASASVEQEGGTGPKWRASIDVKPEVGQDTWGLVSWPGSWFSLEIGWRYGANDKEMITYGEYVHSDDPSHNLRDRISLSLTDRWADLDRADYDTTYKPSGGTRVSRVQEAVRTALSNQQPISVRLDDDGGSIAGDGEWEKRTQLISDLSKDGGFIAYFDYDGVFVIEDEPSMGSPIHVFTDGDDADIIDLTKGGRFTQFYNRVSVYPENPGKLDFTPQAVTIDEPSHPLDPSNNRGVLSVYKYSSPTISSTSSARFRAGRLLRRVMRQKLEREVKSFNLAHIEPGDTVKIAVQATQTEEKEVSEWGVVKTSFDLMTGDSSLTLTSSHEPNLAESEA